MLYFAKPHACGLRWPPDCSARSSAQGNRLPPEALFCVDNNCGPRRNGQPGTRYPGDERYLGLLADLARADGAHPGDPDTSHCLFAVAPDVPGNARATLRRSRLMLAWLRDTGFRAALVAQDGLEHLPVPWGDFDALFLA